MFPLTVLNCIYMTVHIYIVEYSAKENGKKSHEDEVQILLQGKILAC